MCAAETRPTAVRDASLSGEFFTAICLQTDVEQFDISTADRLTVVDLTSEVQERVPPDASGTVTVFVQHTTAGVTVNEGEQRLLSDFEAALADVVPWGRQHDQIAAPTSNTAI